jgi:hypothetical protein
MKMIKYKLATERPDKTLYFADVALGWNEANEEIAKREAYKGEYEIYDDGIEEVYEPTQLDRVESQVAYLAMMTGNTEILEG